MSNETKRKIGFVEAELLGTRRTMIIRGDSPLPYGEHFAYSSGRILTPAEICDTLRCTGFTLAGDSKASQEDPLAFWARVEARRNLYTNISTYRGTTPGFLRSTMRVLNPDMIKALSLVGKSDFDDFANALYHFDKIETLHILTNSLTTKNLDHILSAIESNRLKKVFLRLGQFESETVEECIEKAEVIASRVLSCLTNPPTLDIRVGKTFD